MQAWELSTEMTSAIAQLKLLNFSNIGDNRAAELAIEGDAGNSRKAAKAWKKDVAHGWSANEIAANDGVHGCGDTDAVQDFCTEAFFRLVEGVRWPLYCLSYHKKELCWHFEVKRSEL